MHYIFVYGTLKEGFPNFSYNKGQRVAGEFVTQDRFELYLVGDRYSPWLVQPQENEVRAGQVIGQLFAVNDEELAAMDKLERIYEIDGYKRVTVNIVNQQTDQIIGAFVYLKNAKQLEEAISVMGPLHHYRLEDAALYRSRN